jgi:hypothetical protein
VRQVRERSLSREVFLLLPVRQVSQSQDLKGICRLPHTCLELKGDELSKLIHTHTLSLSHTHREAPANQRGRRALTCKALIMGVERRVGIQDPLQQALRVRMYII